MYTLLFYTKRHHNIIYFNTLFAIYTFFNLFVAGPSSPVKDDIAIIMYTSGSTGVPKGVYLTHQNMIATLKAFTDRMVLYSDDVLLGFLPLAHVYELLAGEYHELVS